MNYTTTWRVLASLVFLIACAINFFTTKESNSHADLYLMTMACYMVLQGILSKLCEIHPPEGGVR